MADDRDREPREIKNHILFEVATEVAHRGMSWLPHRIVELVQLHNLAAATLGHPCICFDLEL